MSWLNNWGTYSFFLHNGVVYAISFKPIHIVYGIELQVDVCLFFISPLLQGLIGLTCRFTLRLGLIGLTCRFTLRLTPDNRQWGGTSWEMATPDPTLINPEQVWTSTEVPPISDTMICHKNGTSFFAAQGVMNHGLTPWLKIGTGYLPDWMILYTWYY